jgi:hypothetical protein
MARPEVHEVAEVVYKDLAGNTFGDEDLDWPLLFFIGCLSGMFSDFWNLVQDSSDRAGYEHLLDPDETPAYALSYLGQFAGVSVHPGWTEAETRLAIKSPAGFRRGTVPHMISIVQRFLTGNKRVIVRERQGGAWKLQIRTLDSESPDGGSVAGDQIIIDALKLESKPAGITLDFESIAGIEYFDLEEDYTTYADIEALGLTYEELSELPP